MNSGEVVFARPPPLLDHENYVLTDGKWYELVGRKFVPAVGVSYEESIYYMWFEYLRRSEKYKEACQNNGKGMEKLFADFGNVYEYEFKEWWIERGTRLFAERGSSSDISFIDCDGVESKKETIESGEIKLIAIPTNLKKTEIRSKLNELLKELEVNPTGKSTALYPLTKSKVNVGSLAKCLLAYDLKREGKSNLYIGGYVDFVDEKLIDESFLIELEEDARKNYVYVENKEMREKFKSKNAENDKKVKAASLRVQRRLERQGREKSTNDNTIGIELEEREELVDRELGILERKTGDEVLNPKTNRMMSRSEWKRYLNTNGSRMVKKAEDNIAAVEEGKFPVGHATGDKAE